MGTFIARLMIPDEALTPLLMMAGILWIVQMRRLSMSIITFVLISAFSPMFEPLIEYLIEMIFVLVGVAVQTMPIWMIIVLGFVIIITVFRFLSALFIGRNSTDHLIGILAADVVRFFFLLPWRLLRFIFRRNAT
jgi:hypothetical protein